MKMAIAALSSVILYSAVCQGEVLYKWVDENDQVHYTHSRPDEYKAEKLVIKNIQPKVISRKQLLGEWRSDDEGSEVFQLSDDRFTVVKQREGEYLYMTGTWEIINRQLELDVVDGYIEKTDQSNNREKKYLKGKTITAIITHLSENKLRINDIKGSTNYTKAQDQEQ